MPSYNDFEFVAGVDSNGSPLGLCNVPYEGSTQAGKFLSYGACNFGFGGSEVSITSGWNVLNLY